MHGARFANSLFVCAASAALALAFVSWVACNSSSHGDTCGTGTYPNDGQCLPVAPDASNLEAGKDAPDDVDGARPPTFAGITAVAAVSGTELMAVWNPGVDPSGSAATLRYRVYVGPAGRPLSYATPAAQTAPGALFAVVSGLEDGSSYVVGVRAIDAAGVEDGNTVTRPGKTTTEDTPPTFAGLASAAPGGSGAVQLSWDAAKDTVTPAAAMTYLVYDSETSGGEEFTSPSLVTAPGATSALVTRLADSSAARFFVVRARNSLGLEDQNTRELSSKPGPDTEPPQFAGCSAATTVQALTIDVTWLAATDAVSDPAHLTYDIFATTTAGQYDFTQPFAVVSGQQYASLSALHPSTQYWFVCRAKNQAGLEDSNTVEVTAKTGANPMPPTFDGLQALANPDAVNRTVTLEWAPATDASTPQGEIVYDVYTAVAPGAEAFGAPPVATSPPGATCCSGSPAQCSFAVGGLPSNATVYFVVRARDADGNHDSNTKELSMPTDASFSLDVQPILTNNCGVVGCHVPPQGNATGSLILAPGFAYSQIVNVTAPETSSVIDGGLDFVAPGAPDASYLNIKINAPLLQSLKNQYGSSHFGTQMPALSTGTVLMPENLTTIANWIQQGAMQN